jgi:hypothetical protein
MMKMSIALPAVLVPLHTSERPHKMFPSANLPRTHFEPGNRFGNYERLEILIPEFDHEDITEEIILRCLTMDGKMCAKVVRHIEKYNRSHHPILWLRHQCLGVPLLYKTGEGPQNFADRLNLRLHAAKQLKLVCRKMV